MFVRVEIEFEEHRNVTVVPTSAQAKREGNPGVFSADLEGMTADSFRSVRNIEQRSDRGSGSARPLRSCRDLGQHLLEDARPLFFGKRGAAAPNRGR
jgi:hypothetical protein